MDAMLEDNEVMGRCMVCHTEGPVRHLPLYVCGSEGLDICTSCRIDLTDHVRSMMRVAAVSRKEGYKACKAVREAKEKRECE